MVKVTLSSVCFILILIIICVVALLVDSVWLKQPPVEEPAQYRCMNYVSNVNWTLDFASIRDLHWGINFMDSRRKTTSLICFGTTDFPAENCEMNITTLFNNGSYVDDSYNLTCIEKVKVEVIQ